MMSLLHFTSLGEKRESIISRKEGLQGERRCMICLFREASIKQVITLHHAALCKHDILINVPQGGLEVKVALGRV